MRSPHHAQRGAHARSLGSSTANPRALRALQSLREVLEAAQTRGIPLTASYQHFDRQARGVVGVDDLMTALVDLHLCSPATVWDEQDAEDCLEALSYGKSRSYCSRDDFVRFFAVASAIEISSSETRLHRHDNERSPGKKRGRNPPHGSPPRELEDAFDSDVELLSVGRERAYSIKSKKTRPQVELPEWAHIRSKRALKELESMQRRRGKLQSPLVFASTSVMTADSFDSAENPPLVERQQTPTSTNRIPPLAVRNDEKQPEEKRVLEFKTDKLDRIFEIDEDHAIAYRLVTHNIDAMSAQDEHVLRFHATTGQNREPDKLETVFTPFLLTIFIDAFQHLETLEAFFEPLLVHFPRGKILLCGHPVRSLNSTVWNNEFFSHGYAKLLQYVMTQSREWLVQPKLGIGAVAQYLVGFGTGASVVLQFLGMEVPMSPSTIPSLQSFAHSLRGVLLINCVVGVNEAVRSTLQNIRVLLKRATTDSVQLHEALLSLLFSEHYLTQVATNRRAALETFFRTRRNFFQGGDGGVNGNAELLRLLVRGVVKNKDANEAITNINALPAPFTVLVVHGSQNALFHPDQIELLTNALSPGVVIAANVRDALDGCPDAISYHQSWIKSGHELLQERTSFMYEIFRQMIVHDPQVQPTHVQVTKEDNIEQTATRPRIPASTAPSSASKQVEDPSITDNVPVDEVRDSADQLTAGPEDSTDNSSSVNARVRDILAQNGLKWIQQELYDRGIEGSGTTESILARYEQVLTTEAAEQRHRQAQFRRQQAKHHQVELFRRDKQRAEVERQVREKEAAISIKRKELETQKAFFAQMEAQKLAQARRQQEFELMAREDILSRKYEDLLKMEVERLQRNDAMAKQVEEIEAERTEIDRAKFQVELQQERLAAQQVKRDALKQFQKQFEQNTLVSSAVEAYCLDLTPDFENFTKIADGALIVAKDLEHFHELKKLQRHESVDRRQELEKRRQELEAKQTAVRNLERVLAKAKSTGMIAKAGLGTVRIVPITPQEMIELARNLDETRDESERLQSDIALRTQELGWKDQLLQRLSVLIKRNESFRTELLVKLGACIDKGNEKMLALREDGEQLLERQQANRRVKERLMARLDAVNAERSRAEQASTEFFDTRLRVEGTIQRVQRSLVIREFTQEAEQLETRITELMSAEPGIKESMSTNSEALNEIGNRTFVVQSAFDTLTNVSKVIASASANRGSSKTLTASGNPFDARDDDDDGGLDSAERVRQKRHVERTPEEKQWVAIDFVLNFAHYYKFVAADEVEIIAKSSEYRYTKLTKEQLQRLLMLPARNCLALAFLKSTDELEAHELIRRFTFGDGEDHFASLDKNFVPIPNWPPRPVATTLESLASSLESFFETKNPYSIQFPKGQTALLDESSAPVTLLSSAGCTLEPHQSVTHTFRLPAHNAVGVLNLSVSIVFQGHFKPVGYQNGRLAGMLYMLPPLDNPSGDMRPQPRTPMGIGKCAIANDIALCTPHNLGRLVLRHEPDVVPLCGDATYQVVLGAPVATSYSIEVTARTALFAGEMLQRKKSDALKKQEVLPLRKDEIQNVFTTIQLSERKKRLARAMANEAKDAGRAAELEMLRATRTLEKDNAESQLSHEERLALHQQIHDAEAAFTQQCFLFAKREEEVRDIEQGLRELTRIHVDLLDECEQMEKDLADYRAYLPRIAASLAEDESITGRDIAGSQVANLLNVDYEPIGERSAKLRWVELSAMKAKLPSMMTPAERLRRKYKRAKDPLDKKEREWILLDRILHPRMYDWEERLATTGNWRARLHGAHPTLTKDEEAIAGFSKLEVERIMKSRWNLLERKEILVRKIVTRFRDDYSKGRPGTATSSKAPTTVVALLRAQKWNELTTEEREWRRYDQLLNPAYYRSALGPTSLASQLQQLTKDLRTTIPMANTDEFQLPPTMTREDIVAALNTPEEEVFKLQSETLRARTLLLKFDPQLSTNLLEAARVQRSQQTKVEMVETDIDARCRLVYDELQRAIANTRNEFMDSCALHSTLQRFPTKVLRLELEKELDRLLKSQVIEREEFELENLLSGKKKDDKLAAKLRPLSSEKSKDLDAVSDSDSDEEAVIAREARAQRLAKEQGSRNQRVRGKQVKAASIQKQRRQIRDVRE